ncbi:MAG: L,D-transpeptidase family protein [Acidobacteria bacterium]|nr:L,D-transpeptidase family protein [Acidobacteriota bacterium]
MSRRTRHTLAAIVLAAATAGCQRAPFRDRSGESHLATGGAEQAAPGQRPAPDTIAAAVRTLGSTLPPGEAARLATLYDRAAGAPLWVGEDGRTTGEARVALSRLRQSDAEGLVPDDYAAPELTRLETALAEPGEPSIAARFDVLLSAGLMRYYRHLHLGRTDPLTLGVQLTMPTDDHDFAEIVFAARDVDGVERTAATLAPPFTQYRALKAALARYRTLAAAPNALPAFTTTVREGDAYAGARALFDWLAALGDLPPGTPPPAAGVYDEALSRAVARFQRRHGLDVDGTLGRATAAALQVPLAWRVRQLEFALERLRWLPDLTGGRVLIVNIPMFRLWAWDAVPSADPPRLDMAVIVGRALDTRTPVFAERMRFVVFRPYWNVPMSILRKELLPEIRRDPSYLQREHLQIVRGQSDSSPVVPFSPETLAELARGAARLRQAAGPFNSLGLVKFMFPNQNEVYLHGTPATALFRQSRRDFSHGCIRVEDPVALAEWVFERQPGWPREAILAAMQGPENRRVDLVDPVQVMIFYTTAAVMQADGAVYFASDVYGQDRLLDRVW